MSTALERLAMCPPEELAIAPEDAPYEMEPRALGLFTPTREPTKSLHRGTYPFAKLVARPAPQPNPDRVARRRAVEAARDLAAMRRAEAQAGALRRYNIALTTDTGRRIDGPHPSHHSWNRGCRCVDCRAMAAQCGWPE